MSVKAKEEAQNPLILRCHRIMDAFAKSDDERDFYLDKREGFLVYIDLEKSQEELDVLELALKQEPDRYCMIPKLSFYETKKIMEGFVNEKVYDVDTKEKLLDIIQSKEARENFLEYVYDHHVEFEKWQQFYQERSRVRIIEWLRQNHFHFVFEEDLDLPRGLLDKLKCQLFESKVSKELLTARKTLISKAKSYYSNEALNPRPKRGRPPKQIVKLEVEPQVSTDIFLTVPSAVQPFLYLPEISTPSAVAFSAKFDGEEDFLARRGSSMRDGEVTIQEFQQKLAALRSLTAKPDLAAVENGDDGDEDDENERPARKRIAAVKKSATATKGSKAAPKASKSTASKAAAKKSKVSTSKSSKAPKAASSKVVKKA
jgi:hypothetical protein